MQSAAKLARNSIEQKYSTGIDIKGSRISEHVINNWTNIHIYNQLSFAPARLPV